MPLPSPLRIPGSAKPPAPFPGIRPAFLALLVTLVSLTALGGMACGRSGDAAGENGAAPPGSNGTGPGPAGASGAGASNPTDGAGSGMGAYVEPPRNVRVLTLATAPLAEYLEVSGTLRPVRGADISAEESGVVAQVLRDKGDRVGRGESILTLDRRILAAEKQAAEANEELTAFNEERTKALFDENSVSGQEMLIAHTQAAEAASQAEIARLRYEKASFPAPFAGVVSERFVEVGELVAPGTRVARIVDPYQLELVGAVSEREVTNLVPGASVEVALEGLGEGSPGEVSWVGFEADPTTGKFPVEITVDNRNLLLRAGVLGRARIVQRMLDEVIAIPRDAVLMTSEGPQVFVVEGGRASRRAVTLGVDQGTLIEARSGLAVGDELIVRGHRDLTDGAPVDVQERATDRDGSLRSDPVAVRAANQTPSSPVESGGIR